MSLSASTRASLKRFPHIYRLLKAVDSDKVTTVTRTCYMRADLLATWKDKVRKRQKEEAQRRRRAAAKERAAASRWVTVMRTTVRQWTCVRADWTRSSSHLCLHPSQLERARAAREARLKPECLVAVPTFSQKSMCLRRAISESTPLSHLMRGKLLCG